MNRLLLALSVEERNEVYRRHTDDEVRQAYTDVRTDEADGDEELEGLRLSRVIARKWFRKRLLKLRRRAGASMSETDVEPTSENEQNGNAVGAAEDAHEADKQCEDQASRELPCRDDGWWPRSQHAQITVGLSEWMDRHWTKASALFTADLCLVFPLAPRAAIWLAACSDVMIKQVGTAQIESVMHFIGRLKTARTHLDAEREAHDSQTKAAGIWRKQKQRPHLNVHVTCCRML